MKLFPSSHRSTWNSGLGDAVLVPQLIAHPEEAVGFLFVALRDLLRDRFWAHAQLAPEIYSSTFGRQLACREHRKLPASIVPLHHSFV